MDTYSMYYVYEHYKKTDNSVFYVGIGKSENGKYERANSLIKRNKHWHSVVKKHGFNSKVVFESDSREEVCSKEIELISFYGRSDLKTGSLVNKTSGGEKTFKMSKDSVKRGVEKRVKNGTYKKCAEIARERMLTANPWKGKTHDGFTNKRVFQYDSETGNFLGEFKSINSAVRQLKLSSAKIISKCLSGENQTGARSLWFYNYQGESVSKVRRGVANYQLKPVIEIDLQGNVLKKWECISDAAKEIGVTSSAIGNSLRKETPSLVKGRILKKA